MEEYPAHPSTLQAEEVIEKRDAQAALSGRTSLSDLKNDSIDGGALEKVETEGYAHGVRLFTLLVGVVLAMFLVALDMTIVSTAIPRISDEFQSLDDVGWYGSAFFLTVAAFQSQWGKVRLPGQRLLYTTIDTSQSLT